MSSHFKFCSLLNQLSQCYLTRAKDFTNLPEKLMAEIWSLFVQKSSLPYLTLANIEPK